MPVALAQEEPLVVRVVLVVRVIRVVLAPPVTLAVSATPASPCGLARATRSPATVMAAAMPIRVAPG